MSEFKREERYSVIKLKSLDDDAKTALQDFLAAHRVQTVECVVVESDWPIYEKVWAMVRKVWEAKQK